MNFLTTNLVDSTRLDSIQLQHPELQYFFNVLVGSFLSVDYASLDDQTDKGKERE